MPLDIIPTEHEEQKNFVQWFRRKYPDVRIFAIPNGGARNPATACRLKVEGVLRGFLICLSLSGVCGSR